MRKTLIILLLANICSTITHAQQKDFEGIISYKTELRSKTEIISDRALKNVIGIGNEETVFIKHGNYKQVSSRSTSYYLTKDQRAYLKYNGVDTLYYIDYSSDTTTVTNVFRSDEKRNIAGFECSLLTIQVGDASKRYYYAPALHMSSDYDKNNKIDRYDVFAKETSSLYLALYHENKTFSVAQTCTRLQQTAVDDSVFQLPKLPQKKFSYDDMVVPPEFNRAGGWTKYLQTNLNGQLGAKYLRIPKGEQTTSQQVMVMFLVNEYGRVSNAQVLDKKEVHPKLAEEALRVINESPPWKPATFLGEKTIFWLKMPITFEVTKQ
jgi:Gram-negative bacterial tonB protein.